MIIIDRIHFFHRNLHRNVTVRFLKCFTTVLEDCSITNDWNGHKPQLHHTIIFLYNNKQISIGQIFFIKILWFPHFVIQSFSYVKVCVKYYVKVHCTLLERITILAYKIGSLQSFLILTNNSISPQPVKNYTRIYYVSFVMKWQCRLGETGGGGQEVTGARRALVRSISRISDAQVASRNTRNGASLLSPYFPRRVRAYSVIGRAPCSGAFSVKERMSRHVFATFATADKAREHRCLLSDERVFNSRSSIASSVAKRVNRLTTLLETEDSDVSWNHIGDFWRFLAPC